MSQRYYQMSGNASSGSGGASPAVTADNASNRFFDEYCAQFAQTLPLNELRGAYIGIDAAYWLTTRLNGQPQAAEPLLCALGGGPHSLEKKIERELDAMKELDITPIFFFNGLEVAAKDAYKEDQLVAMQKRNLAWTAYERVKRDGTIEALRLFAESASIRPEDNFRLLQHILWKRSVSFFVAPYGAWSQLAYFASLKEQFIDGIMGSTELFLFKIDKIITRLDTEGDHFTWITRSAVLESFGESFTDDMLVDTQLLSGSAYLPMFPLLETSLRRGVPVVREAANMVNACGRSGYGVVSQFQEDKAVQRLNYVDRFKRSKTAVRHGVVFTLDGKVEPLDGQHVPSDLYSIVGQRLPDEIYFYVQQGVCSPRVLNWLTSGFLIETPPLDNGDYEGYRRLVRTELAPLRTQALALLTKRLHNFYQRKNVEVKFWWDAEVKETLSTRSLEQSPSDAVTGWLIRAPFMAEAKKHVKSEPGSLLFCFECLAHPDLMAKTVTAKAESGPGLSNSDEILATATFRFLQLVGYVDGKTHQATALAKGVLAAVAKLSSAKQQELIEQLVVTFELARRGLLTGNDTVPSHYGGKTQRGTDSDKWFALLASRTAAVLQLHHQPTGYFGPLSRTLLAQHGLTVTVRNTLRDLIEMVLVNMLLSGTIIDREALLSTSKDKKVHTALQDLGMRMPFLHTPSSAMSIALKSYLDEFTLALSPPSNQQSQAALSFSSVASSNPSSTPQSNTTSSNNSPRLVPPTSGIATPASSTTTATGAAAVPTGPLTPEQAKQQALRKGKEMFRHASEDESDIDAALQFVVAVVGDGLPVGLEGNEALKGAKSKEFVEWMQKRL